MNEALLYFIYSLLILIMETFFDGTFIDPESEVPIKLLKSVSEQVVMGSALTSIIGSNKQAITAVQDDDDDVTARPVAGNMLTQNKYETTKAIAEQTS